jgi:hypothetical protein
LSINTVALALVIALQVIPPLNKIPSSGRLNENTSPGGTSAVN